MSIPPAFPLQVGPPSDADLAAIAAILHEIAGIVIAPEKGAMVQSRLARRLRTLGLDNFAGYVDLLRSPDGIAERKKMISALTTNVTQFFREGHHFDLLRDTALPPLLAGARAGGRVRIWSAGCSTGQEAFSIAMVLADLAPDLAGLDLRILATDIDAEMIEKGRTACYAQLAADAVPPGYRKRFLEPLSGGVRVNTALRNLVTFQEHNLHGAWPIRGRFDVIFCRNVVIYFDQAAQDRLWRRFEQTLNPGGWLFAGHSERIRTDRGSRLETAGVTAYRLAGPAGPQEAAAWR